MRYLITGASGLIGTALTTHLRSRGHQVTHLVRRQPETGSEFHWDPTTGQMDECALEGLDGVVHLAGENVASGRWSRARMKEILSSRQRGTELLSHAIANAQVSPPVLVSASAIGAYGDRGEELLTEGSSTGTGFLPDVCRIWEGSADPARAAGVRVVHPRIGLVLAPDGGALQRMLLPFQVGLGGPIGRGDNWLSWISLQDQVRVIEKALSDSRLEGPVNSVAPNPERFSDFAQTLGRVLHRPVFLRTPALAMRALMGRMVDELMLASTRVAPERLLKSGFDYDHSTLESALRSVLSKPLEAVAS